MGRNERKIRSALLFHHQTSRKVFFVNLPCDWGDGWDNVSVYCTVENQHQADIRLLVYLELPVKHKGLCLEPLLGDVDLTKYKLKEHGVDTLVVGGESGQNARLCRFEWVRHLRAQAEEAEIAFHFKQTGARFEKDGRTFVIFAQIAVFPSKKSRTRLPSKADQAVKDLQKNAKYVKIPTIRLRRQYR